MGGLFDWDSRDDVPEPTPDRVLASRVPRRGRKMVLAICCPDPACESLNVHRTSSKGVKAYWQCDSCGEAWTEAAEVGMGSAARLADS